MKICIVIQSDAFRTSAGVRIRYDRFRETIPAGTATIDILTCGELAIAPRLEHDAYIFCKTFDTTALLLARKVRAAGKVVGQDLFDDYFSQRFDSRLQRYREWLRGMAPVTNFAICSTERMVEVVRSYLPDVPVTLVADPVAGFDPGAVATRADEKVHLARSTKVVEVAWFGIGDNPFFPVGLADLAACDPQLARLQRLGWAVRLRIITNRRAFEGINAEVLRRLSVPFEVTEWSEESERDALASATVAILPVNGQSFSRAKSLNRALTASSAGCQVLSVGYPLYDELRDFIYRSVDALSDDLVRGSTRLSAPSVNALAMKLSALADPAALADKFVGQARSAHARRGSRPPGSVPVCVIHGRASVIGVHKAVGAIGGFSVKTVFCDAAWNFPVRFDAESGEILMRVTTQIAQKFDLPLREGTQPRRFGIFDLVDVDTAELGVAPLRISLSVQSNPLMDLPIYEDAMRFATACCGAAFPGADVLISDTSVYSRKPVVSTPPRRPRRSLSALGAAAGGPTTSQARRSSSKRNWLPVGKVPKLAGRRKGRSTDDAKKLLAGTALFDPDWYLARYPDVAARGVDPVGHYLEFGWREGRNPSPLFSTRAYLKANRDVAEQGINPLLHYVEHGQFEGRTAPPPVKGTPSS